VLKRNWREALGMTIVYTVQMVFFPGPLLDYQWSFIKSSSWFTITFLTAASLSDTLGRSTAACMNPITKKAYLPATVIRAVVFVSLFICLEEEVAPGFFGSSWFTIIFMFFFQVTLGILTVLGFKYGTDESTVDRSTAGIIMGFSLTLGLSLGTAIQTIAFA